MATIFQTSIAPKKVHLGAFDSLEYLAIKDPKKVLILTLYKPPKSKSNFFNDFSNLLSVICMDYDKLIIVGDFNIHYDKPKDVQSKMLNGILDSFGLTQHVSVNTQPRTHSRPNHQERVKYLKHLSN